MQAWCQSHSSQLALWGNIEDKVGTKVCRPFWWICQPNPAQPGLTLLTPFTWQKINKYPLACEISGYFYPEFPSVGAVMCCLHKSEALVKLTCPYHGLIGKHQWGSQETWDQSSYWAVLGGQMGCCPVLHTGVDSHLYLILEKDWDEMWSRQVWSYSLEWELGLRKRRAVLPVKERPVWFKSSGLTSTWRGPAYLWECLWEYFREHLPKGMLVGILVRVPVGIVLGNISQNTCGNTSIKALGGCLRCLWEYLWDYLWGILC